MSSHTFERGLREEGSILLRERASQQARSVLLLLSATASVLACSACPEPTDVDVPAFECLESVPGTGATSPVDSLMVEAPTILWRRSIPTSGPPYLVFTGRHLAAATDRRLWVISRGGEITGMFEDFFSQTGGPPVADPVRDRFYFATSALWAIQPDGTVAWAIPFGENKSDRTSTTYGSRPALSSEDTLYVAASDGIAYAVSAADGRQVWTMDVGLRQGKPQHTGPGVGSVLFINGTAVDARTGAVGPTPTVGGHVAFTTKVVAGGIEASWLDAETGQPHMNILDRCFAPRWSHPEGGWRSRLVGYEDDLLITDQSRAAIYSSQGELRIGPKQLDGSAVLLGRDNLIYTAHCRSEGGAQSGLELRAYDWSLGFKWMIDLGPCLYASFAVLDDEGVLYIARGVPGVGMGAEIIAVQTTSPGLADTLWPTFWRDNAATNWWGGGSAE